MFIDRVKIYVKAGSGGKGCASFRRSRRRRIKVPDGGDGGNGGDVVIRVDPNLKSLLDFRYRQHFKASSGGLGGSNNKKGRSGAPRIIKVPGGTQISDAKTSCLIRDLIKADEEVIVAKGGKGGRGNKGRRDASQGEAGQVRELELELKLIADVGIIGFPNSGKSTLIRRISNARPKVASYPFTTLAPVLGTVRSNDYGDIVVCEVPGLIEGAHRGRGLGHSFLRHIERTKILVHLVDMAPPEARDPIEDYRSLNRELQLHDPRLIEKVQVLVANKMDLPQADANLRALSSKAKEKVCPVSALSGQGLEELVSALYEELKKETLKGCKESCS